MTAVWADEMHRPLGDSERWELPDLEGEYGYDIVKAAIVKPRNGYTLPVVRNLDGALYLPRIPCKWGVVRQLRDKCKHAQIPARYANKTFRDYDITADNERAVGLARRFILAKPEQGLYLYGETGTGKTFLAALIAREYISDLSTVIFGDVPALLDELKATFDKGGTEELLNRYCDCDLLVLDDLGAGQITEWNIGVLYRLINARYSENKPIIATRGCW